MSIVARHSVLSGSLCLLLSCSVTGGLVQAQTVDPEWPCIQRLVLEVSPAVMWPLPVEEEMHSQWKQDAVIRPLAERLGDLPAYTAVEQEALQSFAQGIPDEQKETQLTLLAVGILDVTNGIRRQYIDGIKRYTRQQIAIADQIGDTLNRISSLEDSSQGAPGDSPDSLPGGSSNDSSNDTAARSPELTISGEPGSTIGSSNGTDARSPDMPVSGESDSRQEELMSTLRWHERIYDQREHAIRSLCEQPVELEEILSDVLRDLAQYLP